MMYKMDSLSVCIISTGWSESPKGEYLSHIVLLVLPIPTIKFKLFILKLHMEEDFFIKQHKDENWIEGKLNMVRLEVHR